MSNYLLRLFKGLCLLFLSNVPGAMFIQGGTFIQDSRVRGPYLCAKNADSVFIVSVKNLKRF